eukprot:Blabericola_migrator_1__4828@NODE_2534_length_2636_cov_43_434021_g1585_i0_p1_GENE_NODE_2534_length_2636_cov_43_434021_g1585_i0NODE_2534_length_2636_cov_43_434021_g1585_i0_p1_ORF_typecomplete_len348_score48_60_NODE_2534_length_2636_cov_43_434021_g1585_i02081251
MIQDTAIKQRGSERLMVGPLIPQGKGVLSESSLEPRTHHQRLLEDDEETRDGEDEVFILRQSDDKPSLRSSLQTSEPGRPLTGTAASPPVQKATIRQMPSAVNASKRRNVLEGKRLRCLPKRKPGQQPGARRAKLKHWWNESVLPTCLRRRRNGEGKIIKRDTGSVIGKRSIEVPVLANRHHHEGVDPIFVVDDLKHNIETPIVEQRNDSIVSFLDERRKLAAQRSSKQSPEICDSTRPSSKNSVVAMPEKIGTAHVKVAATVLPPPQSKGQKPLNQVVTNTETVIPKGLASDANLGQRESKRVFSRMKSKAHKAVFSTQPKPPKDLYEGVIHPVGDKGREGGSAAI